MDPAMDSPMDVSGEGLRIAVVAARFYAEVADRLVDGATDTLQRHGVRPDDIEVVWVPGSFELPLTASVLARSGRWDAVVCLGAVIRGETAHFDHVCTQAATGIAAASRETEVPVMFGVLTTDTMEQALERSGGAKGNRGADAALGAIQMANLLRDLQDSTGR